MAGVDIKYKGNSIASIQGSGSKTLKTEGKYCEGDIHVDYVKEGITPSGTKNISTNGTHDVTDYASANVSVPPNVTSKSIGANGTYNASSDNVDGYDVVTVNIQPLFSQYGVMYFTEMKIPNTVTRIKSSAYQTCINMRKLEIAGSVKSIDSYAFQNAYITELILNEGIETIGDYAFNNHRCQTIALPSSTKTIGTYAFSSLAVSNQIVDLSAFVDPNNLPTLKSSNAFADNKVLRYEVANQSMLDAFEAATNWSTYSGKYVIKG